MQIHNNAEVASEQRLSHSQNITGKAPKLLPCSSIASCPDQGSNAITTLPTGEEKECPNAKWYYLYLNSKQLKRYIEIFTGKKALVVQTRSGKQEERHFCFKVFSYTSIGHKKRFEQCPYNKEEYNIRREAAFAVKEAFATGSTQKLNALTDEKSLIGSGYLFVCAPLDELNQVLAHILPRHYLSKDRSAGRPAVIPHKQMEEFIYLYESMPYNIELMDRPLEEYIQKKQKIRITGGVFQGKEGCIMRLHRNTKLVFAFGNMTVAIGYLHAFPFEKVE